MLMKFVSNQLLKFCQRPIDIATNDDDFDLFIQSSSSSFISVSLMVQTVPDSTIEDDGTKNKM